MNPAFAGDGGVIQQAEQRVGWIGQWAEVIVRPGPELLELGRWFLKQCVLLDGGVIGEGGGRNLGSNSSVMQHPNQRFLQHAADHSSLEPPTPEPLHQRFLAAGLDHKQHPLLGLREQKLIRGHPGFPGGHPIQVQFNAEPPFGRHFRTAAGETSRTHVLGCHDIPAGEGLQTGFDQSLFKKGVTHLHRRPVIEGVGTEFGTGEAGTTHAIATGGAAHVDHGIPDTDGSGFDDLVGFHQAKGHGIDQRIPGIGRVEGDFTTHGWHADAIAVMGDPGHNPFDQSDIGRILQRTEAQGVEQGDRTGPHREDVPKDPAHTRGSPLKRFHRRRVVVTLDLERKAMAITQIHHTGVFARAHQDPRTFRREAAEQRPGVAVAAVFGPHHTEHAQFRPVGRSVEPPTDLIPVPGLQSFLLESISNVIPNRVSRGNHNRCCTSYQCCRQRGRASDPGILIPGTGATLLLLVPELIVPILQRIHRIGWRRGCGS